MIGPIEDSDLPGDLTTDVLTDSVDDSVEPVSEITIGHTSCNSGTEINVADVPDRLNPKIDWFHGVPILYIYGISSEEPVLTIELPTQADPEVTLKNN